MRFRASTNSSSSFGKHFHIVLTPKIEMLDFYDHLISAETLVIFIKISITTT
jgi:hypothetical protein